MTIKTNIQKSIQAALQAHLRDMPNVPSIVWPNEQENEHDINNAKVYLAPHFRPSSPEIETSEREHYVGFIQIDIFTTLDIGEGLLVQYLDKISDHYRASPVLERDGVFVATRVAGQGGRERRDNWYWGWIQINYDCFA